ncbi:MAG: PTS sugar transporter subunit IIC [Erysipelotrichaceae bacterium]|jgi:PTS system mannose-specific IIC component|nr:PTS sugar transporter subunit IIC [Erysipelotrichaceae bacterium]
MFTGFQIIAITLLMFLSGLEGSLSGFFFTPYGSSILLGWITGLIMGDTKIGLTIGGTMELMGIGMNPLGGSSVPNYSIGTVIGTAFAVASGVGIEIGIATAIPAATLSVQLDVLQKALGSFFYHKAMTANENGNHKAMYNWIRLGFLPQLFIGTFAVMLMLVGGSAVVELVINTLPQWLLTGFQKAGGVLPALGFAILLRSLPIQGNFMYVLIGFVLASYMGLPMLAIAIIGLALAMLAYKQNKRFHELSEAKGVIDDE